jgi:integrase
MSIDRRQTKNRGTVYEVRLRKATGQEYSRTFRTKKEAERFEATQRADRARGSWIDPRRGSVRIEEIAEEWMASHPGKKESSLARDRSILDVHILPYLGDCHVDQLMPADVQRLVNEWSVRLEPRTVRRQYAVLRAILGFAVDSDRISRSPCRKVKLPEGRPVNHRIITPEELRTLAAAMDSLCSPMVYLAAVLGLRWGECAGLQVRGVDFLARTVTVSTQRTRGMKGRMLVGEPKWQSERTLAAPALLLELLAEHFACRELTGADPEALVFVSPDGAPLHYSNWRTRVWGPACEQAQLKSLTFQALRTANATAMVALAVDVKTAQARAGHRHAATTLDLYARPTVAADRTAARKLGEYFLSPEGAGERESDAG